MDSFIPYWGWDVPAKKLSKSGKEKKEKKVKRDKTSVTPEEVPRIVELAEGED